MDSRRLGKAGLEVLLLAGYYGFVKYTGIGILCLFRYIFHLQCPGCGITHMLTALGSGNFPGAFLRLLLPAGSGPEYCHPGQPSDHR
ncbi:MAG: DUF2752 domain-containing protein [Lachnospiraceae bacterium]|nr:DUF2752 domain-containing protein [Lachnospiraceae bacterium]